jgi:DNA-binding FadR family transcriptional regulator
MAKERRDRRGRRRAGAREGGLAQVAVKPVRIPRLHDAVQDNLRAFISDNGLRAGDSLPAEGDLAQSLGVSRNSVREAVKALESVGVLESRRGIGVFVKPFSFDPLLDNLAYGLGDSLAHIEHVLEVRRAIEVGLIDKALRLMGQDDHRALRECVDAMGAQAARGESFPDEDRRFHLLLFRCLDNAVLDHLIALFWATFHKISNFVNLRNSDPFATWRDHVAIVEAVTSGNVADARRRLDQHYAGILRVIAEAGAADPPSADLPVIRKSQRRRP